MSSLSECNRIQSNLLDLQPGIHVGVAQILGVYGVPTLIWVLTPKIDRATWTFLIIDRVT